MTSQKRVEFRTEDDVTLVGTLRAPAHARAAVAFTGPFTGVKEQVVGVYAAALATAGYATLTFDHRNFGESGGTVRQHEDAAGKLTDLRAAVTYLGTEGFERIGLTGVCLGAGYALTAASRDPRVSAVACVAGAYPSGPADFAHRGGDYRDALRHAVDHGWDVDGKPVYQPAVAAGGAPAAMRGDEPFAYYGTERSYSPHWENRISIASGYQIMTVDSRTAAQLITPTPLLIVHGLTDTFCEPAGALGVYDRAGNPKKLVWLPTTNHIDLYDVPEYVEPACAELAQFYDQYL